MIEALVVNPTEGGVMTVVRDTWVAVVDTEHGREVLVRVDRTRGRNNSGPPERYTLDDYPGDVQDVVEHLLTHL